ncbi:hypothetical protein C8R44DRAFT_133772 [Mycena epipterygia]|nr:hypothetical protein C8R44DRAFT_133772 [Mycena epipterygia]
MRLGVCSMEIFTGAAIAISLLYYRSRMVTMLSILPPKNPNAPATALNRRIFVQSAGNWRANGTIFPLSACKLTRVEEKVMLLQITGQEGGWQLNLRHSAIDGVPATSVEQACKTFGAHWRGAGGKGTILTT